MLAMAGKKSVVWGRLICAAVTVAALCVVFHRLKLGDLVHTVRTMRWGCFLAALALFGLLFLPAAERWHLVLRLLDRAVNLAATARVSLIGHFFYTVLFGVVGGDTAKSALYARWYRLPLPEVLAAAPLDRLLGFAGLLIFASGAVVLAADTDGFAGSAQISFQWPGQWAWAILSAAGLVIWLVSRARPESAGGRFWRTFVSGGKLLLASPRIALAGVGCGLLVQMALSGVLALNLQAVSQTPVPWSRLIWTFPVITMVSALPITVAGLGVREGAALMLLGHYGIPETDAVAASLLTATVTMAWAAVGAVLLWRGEVMPDTFFDSGEQRAAKVHDLFARIAPRYDLINDLQSFGLHRYWKRRLIQMAGARPGARALDVCCGTGDIAFALARCGAGVVGLDFGERMLGEAEGRKSKVQSPKSKVSGNAPYFIRGDAQRIPFADKTFDIVTVGYGLRNLASWETGLQEMRRVAKSGGRLLALDFGKPENGIWRGIYFGYLKLFVPWLGRVFCGNAAAYAYILESLKHYPAQLEVARKMREMGLVNVRVVNLLGGAMSINYGEIPPALLPCQGGNSLDRLMG